jgi:hypothetical protein
MSGQSDAGVSWRDVSVTLRALSKTYGLSITLRLSVPFRKDVGVLWDVRAVAEGVEVGSGRRIEVGAHMPWPCAQAKTFAGLCLLALWDLDRKLSEWRDERGRAEAGPNRLPGF